MGKYNNIAVIYGSDTSEWVISCRSGEFAASRIDDTSYNVFEIFARFGKWQLVAFKKKDSMRVTFPEEARPEVNKNDFSISIYGEKIKFDYAYIMQHGAPGETGQLQGYLEMLGVPYSSCSSFVSAVVFDKYACKSYLKEVDFVKFAPDAFVRKGDDIEIFSKKTLERLGTRELTCAAYKDGNIVKSLPVIEIITENDYFDYDAKYNGHSQEVCPAEISSDLATLIQETTQKIYGYLGCKGLVRMDYISAEDGLYFLEINTIPGMTSASLVPKMVRAAGMDITSFLSAIIDNS